MSQVDEKNVCVGASHVFLPLLIFLGVSHCTGCSNFVSLSMAHVVCEFAADGRERDEIRVQEVADIAVFTAP